VGPRGCTTLLLPLPSVQCEQVQSSTLTSYAEVELHHYPSSYGQLTPPCPFLVVARLNLPTATGRQGCLRADSVAVWRKRAGYFGTRWPCTRVKGERTRQLRMKCHMHWTGVGWLTSTG
jgi:hypothetical protein